MYPNSLKNGFEIKGNTCPKRNYTKEFAQSSGISQSNLSNYLNGNISPTLDTLKKIATNLNVDVVELFREKDEVEIYAKYDGILYPINKSDILDIISKKSK